MSDSGLEHVCLCLTHNDAARSVQSLPLVGRGWGWGSRDWRTAVCHAHHPLPNPPPQGGREQTEFAARADSISHERALTALSGHRVGNGKVAVAHPTPADMLAIAT